jgi:hypothetical protein
MFECGIEGQVSVTKLPFIRDNLTSGLNNCRMVAIVFKMSKAGSKTASQNGQYRL